MADYSISELPVEATDNDTGDLYEVAVPDGEGGFISAKKSHATLTEDLATDAELIAHTGDTDNPHEVTAAQVGAPTTAQLTSHTGDATIHRSIDDDATGSTDLWSAEKIATELATKADSEDLATVATTGSYNNLTDKPAIPDELADLDTTVTGTQLDSMKSKLDGVATGATANATDAQLRDRSTHTGTQSADTIVDGTTNHVFTAADDAKLAGVASGATANSTDATLLNRANHTGTQSASTISDFNASADARITAQKASANGLATLGADSKIPSSQLPSIALTDVYTVSSQSAQLALSAQEGDVAVRTDQNKSYVHNGGTAGTMSDWTLLATPTDTVTSVNGDTGTVVLTTSDIAEGTNLYYSEGRVSANTDVAANTADRHSHANKSVLDATSASFTTSLKTKLDGIATGAEANINADWDATSGDAQILNKPTLGSAAAQNTTAFATAAQGTKADSAVQPADLGNLAAKDTVAISDIAATGTPSSSTYLKGDGTWGSVAAGDTLPDQTGNSGKYLTTDGTDASWGTISTGGLGNVVEDTTPQLGGDLDLNSHKVGDATAADLTKLHGLTATSTELNYVDGVTSAIQTQLDGKAASSHTHTASQITDFDTEVSNNADVAANTSARHAAVTVFDSSEIDFTLTGQQISASLKSGSIDETKLDTSVNASLDLADSATQPGDLATVATTGAYADLSGAPAIPDALTDLDTTVTGAQLNSLKTKVDGIEASADVTDAANVASAIHGTTNKTTPVNADELALIDSAASNALKKLTWSNAKATLKTYFDSLYAAISHTHAESDITGLTTDLAGKVNTTTTINGQALSGNVTLDADDLDDATTTHKFTTAANITKLAGIEAGAQANDVDSVNGQTGAVSLDADDVLPTQTGNSGKYLTTNGSTASWATVSAGTGDTNHFNDYTANQSGLTSSGLDALTGSVNGSNTTFTVSDAVYVAGTLQVYLNGVLQVLGDAIAETTPSSGIFDFVAAPPTSSQIYVRYATQETTSDSVVVASDLADVATSGSYNDLSGTPSLSGYATKTGSEVLTNKDLTSGTNTFPTLNQNTTGNAATATKLATARTIAGQSFDGTANISIAPTDLTSVTATASEINILDGATLSTTELNYVDGVTSAIQTQIDAKVDESTLSASGKGFVNHGSTASTARPSGYASVEWFGSVEPSNSVDGDTWIQIP